MKLIQLALVQHRFVVLCTVIVAGIAGVGFHRVHRQWWPEVASRTALLEIEYPGAAPGVLSEMVIQPIEHELKNLDDIDRIESVASANVALLRVDIDPAAPNPQRVLGHIQRAIDRAALPALPDHPVVHTVAPVAQSWKVLALTGLPTLPRQAQAMLLEMRLRAVPGIGRVTRPGWHAPRIAVTVRKADLERYQVSFDDLRAALQARNVNVPGGRLLSPSRDREYLLRIAGELAGPDDVAEVVVRANDRGVVVRVADVAHVAWEPDEARRMELVGADEATVLFIEPASHADAVTVGRLVDAAVADFLRQAPDGLRVTAVLDTIRMLDRAVQRQVGYVLLATLVVLLVAARAVGWGAACVALWNVWLVIGLTTAGLALLGGTMNLVALWTWYLLVPVLMGLFGRCVQTVAVRRAGGVPADEAVVEGIARCLGPCGAVALGVLFCTVPLLVMDGPVGAVARWVPLQVTLAMGLAVVCAVTLLPVHLHYVFACLWRGVATPPGAGAGRWLAGFPGRRRWTLVGGACVVWGMVALVLAPRPPHVVRAEFRFAPDTTLATNIATMAALAGHLPSPVWSRVGSAGDDAPFDPAGGRGSQVAQLFAPVSAKKLERLLVSPVARQQLGRVSATVHPADDAGHWRVTMRGDVPAEIAAAVAAWRDAVKAADADAHITDEPLQQIPEWQVVLDAPRALSAGVSLAGVGQSVQAALVGETVTTIRRGSEEIDVVVRYPDAARRAGVDTVVIANERRQLTPFSAVAQVVQRPASVRLSRVDRTPAMTVRMNATHLGEDEVNTLLARVQRQYPALLITADYRDDPARAVVRRVSQALLVGLALAGSLVFVFVRP